MTRKSKPALVVTFTPREAAALAEASPQRLAAWTRAGVIAPRMLEADDRSPSSEPLYEFDDLVVLSLLRRLVTRYRVPISELGHVVSGLAAIPRNEWPTMVCRVDGHRVRLESSEPHVATSLSSNGSSETGICLCAVEADVRRAVHDSWVRRAENIGKVERHRDVMANLPVLAGTRIPTRAVWNFHRAGYDTDAIIAQYPDLSPSDVDAAIEYERARRSPRPTPV